MPNAGTPRYQLSSGGTSLSITTVEGGDEGEFVCRATNPGGFREDTVDLVVYSECNVGVVGGCGWWVWLVGGCGWWVRLVGVVGR